MIIRCWGARGSIPVSGQAYLKYGGDTTCMEIRTSDNDIILIDAGTGIRALGNALVAEERFEYTLIFTHGHWDHIMGFPFFKPLYNSKTHLNIVGCSFTQSSIKDMLAPSMSAPHFPVNFDDIKADIVYQGSCSGKFTIKSMTVETILLSHPNQGIGYKFTEDGKSFVFLTDNELSYRHPGGLDYANYLAFTRNADFLIHDAEYTREEYMKTVTWGHTQYEDALRLALDARVRQYGMFHHNQDRSDEQIDAIVADCSRIIQQSGKSLDCFAVAQGMEIVL